MPTLASQWRLELARRIGRIYARHPRVRAVSAYGSVAYGTADSYSDIDLMVYWESCDPESIEQVALHRAGGTRTRLVRTEQLRWWHGRGGRFIEKYRIEELKVDITHRTVESFESQLRDVLHRHDVDGEKQLSLWLQSTEIPLHNRELVDRWKVEAAEYPDGLADAMVRNHLLFFPRARFERLAPDPGSALYCRQILCATGENVMGILLGLNRVYGTVLNLKLFDRWIRQMRTAPADLAQRLRRLVEPPASRAVALRHELIEATLELVDLHLPGIATGPARELYSRPLASLYAAPSIAGGSTSSGDFARDS